MRDHRYAAMFMPARQNITCLRILNRVQLPETILAELVRLKKKNYYTYRHILITALLSTKISLDRQIPGHLDPYRMAALAVIHDLGKAKIPVSILNKRTPLTDAEFLIMKTHPLIGYLMVRYYCGKNYRTYAAACFEHHERLDGSGYPLRTTRMSKYSQVIAVVDMLDALISRRPYRKQPYTMRAALDLLLEEANRGKINKTIVLLLICYARATKPALNDLVVSQTKRDREPEHNNYGKTVPDDSDDRVSP
ncbi:MAG: HD domain-containing protein [Candidatus Omnitrophica bacterium]|nr:HD domain-containing protein [Candidatus Omnitrophota bacterium]